MTSEQTTEETARRAAMAAASKRIDQVKAWLHVGGALPPEDHERLRTAGVTHVVDLREDHEVDAGVQHLAEFGIDRKQVAVPNRQAPTTDQVVDVLDWFPAASEDASLYVHCQGGFGRAGTMAVGLLVQSGLSMEQAEREVRAVRPEININDEQRGWLQELEAGGRQP
jgi:atypical dual specificity phosphatase